MPLVAITTNARRSDGRNAGQEAARAALDKAGNRTPFLAMVFFSPDFPAQAVMNGVSNLLGNTPIWGFSTPYPFANGIPVPGSVSVALLFGDNLKAQTYWWPDFSRNRQENGQKLVNTIESSLTPHKAVLLASDGYTPDADSICQSIHQEGLIVIGAVGCGSINNPKSVQMAGTQANSGGSAVAALQGKLSITTAQSTGWLPVGRYFTVTAAEDGILMELDHQTPVDMFTSLFGQDEKSWSQPPLNELARLYPFSIETPSSAATTVLRSAVNVLPSGSFQLNGLVPLGQTAHLQIASRETCLQSARDAAQKALEPWENKKPALALVWIDMAYPLLLDSGDFPELTLIQEILGKDIPIIGGYTLGQISRPDPSLPPVFQNQMIQITCMGDG
ncbi:MAG TPA: FIST N-terminal domain-containing protein [Anaerolineaceae bacterium]|nr:FIST N-terminal domain-containing protein [Anaerolineaceae bacterium]HPN52735.1 FIST N-terminal domain-containing protein [Anaerolineaceae bacterium]